MPTLSYSFSRRRTPIFWRGYTYFLIPALVPLFFILCNRYLPDPIARHFAPAGNWSEYLDRFIAWNNRFEGLTLSTALMGAALLLVHHFLLAIPRVQEWCKDRMPFWPLAAIASWLVLFPIILVPRFH